MQRQALLVVAPIGGLGAIASPPATKEPKIYDLHPRVSGENGRCTLGALPMYGSPPLTRGKHFSIRACTT